MGEEGAEFGGVEPDAHLEEPHCQLLSVDAPASRIRGVFLMSEVPL